MMKNAMGATLAALTLLGCGGANTGAANPNEAANMAYMGINDDKLKEKVTFDTDCPAAQIEVVKKREDQGSGDYVVNACGSELKYGRTGSVYHAAGQDPVAAMNGEKATPPVVATESVEEPSAEPVETNSAEESDAQTE